MFSKGELARKLVHIGCGFLALALPRLGWKGGALLALSAFAFNLLVLPRIGGRNLERDADQKRGYSVGILLYPLVVLGLILFWGPRSPSGLAFAAAGWGILAFGDGFATLAGLSFGGPSLPWNEDKSWAGLLGFWIIGTLGAGFLFLWCLPLGGMRSLSESLGIFAFWLLPVAIAALVESLPSELDDNLLPPFVGVAVAHALGSAFDARLGGHVPELSGSVLAIAAGVNLALAVIGAWARVVRPSGAVAGALLGGFVLACGGWRLYLLLLTFFAVGTLATRFRKAQKEAMGKAEAEGGRRGAENVLSKVSVPAFGALVAAFLPPQLAAPFLVGVAACFATALMDTLGTEVGQVVRSRTVLLPMFREVPPGTDGAVSVSGTLAGLAGAIGIALLALATSTVTLWGAGVVVVAALLATTIESLLGREGAPWKITNGHVLNFYAALAGFTAGVLLA